MRKFPVAAVILIVLGVVFLLHNLGVLPIPLRELFATWWPVILILVGVSLLLRRK
jgi:hypothetical protein